MPGLTGARREPGAQILLRDAGLTGACRRAPLLRQYRHATAREGAHVSEARLRIGTGRDRRALRRRAGGDAPSEIKFGTLYASSGPFAGISMPVHYGLKLWVDQKNAEGGVFVKAFNKKIPIKLVAYDDQSNTATAATLYNQLITQDKVDILVSDSGSVLTSVGGADRARPQDAADRPDRHRRRLSSRRTIPTSR